MFRLTDQKIDPAALRAEMDDPSVGAIVAFEGIVRNHHEGRAVSRLHYAFHPAMAEKTGRRLLEETLRKFKITKALAIHRVGTLEIGEIAVLTLVSAAHRDEAFAANRFLIDAIKSAVPIWKYETYADGQEEWTAPCPGCSAKHSH